MNKLSFLWLAAVLTGGVIGCGGETIAGGQNGANLNGAGSGGSAGGNSTTCSVEQIGKPCDAEGTSCKTGLKCEPVELVCKGGVWTADKSCGEGGAGGAAGNHPGGAGGSTGGAAGNSGKSCGGLAGLTCAADEYCKYDVKDMCGAADQQGVCTKKPEACDASCSADLLCGCDGKKYCSECVAALAGTSVTECKPQECTDPNTPAKECVDGKVRDTCFGPTAGVPAPYVDCGGGTCVQDGQTCPGGKACGGFAGLTCAANEYCKYDPKDMCGAADQQGVCTAKPADCGVGCPAPEFWVCGCDGNKYCNECEASKAGTSVTECKPQECVDPNTPAKVCVDGKVQDICLGPTEGAPAPYVDCGSGTCVQDGQTCPDGKACGGFAGLACAADEYCKYDSKDMCGAADQQGVCTKKPTECPVGCTLESPLCGCDGNQYCSECDANKAGTSVTDCNNAPKACGGKMGKECAADEFCDYEPSAQCGAFDSTGICVKKPDACDAVCGFVPTCGCDGKDYCNECEANAKGVSATDYSFCHPTPNPKACGGFAGETCAADEYCDFDGDTCGAADQQGVCKPRPSCGVGCPAPEFWVCGCDGKKYCTACEAASNGADVIPCAP